MKSEFDPSFNFGGDKVWAHLAWDRGLGLGHRRMRLKKHSLTPRLIAGDRDARIVDSNRFNGFARMETVKTVRKAALLARPPRSIAGSMRAKVFLRQARCDRKILSALLRIGLTSLLPLLAACPEHAIPSAKSASPSAVPPSAPAVPVLVGSVVQKTVPVRLRAIGTAEAYSTVAVKARIDGELMNVHFKEGDEVKKGDPLFSIDPRPSETEMKEAKANLARDNARAKNARDEADRYANLIQKGVVAQEQYDQIRANANALTSAIEADNAAIERANLHLDYCAIQSPIDGRTGSLMVHAGNLVKANDTQPLVIIHQIRPIYVTFSVPEQNLGAIKDRMGNDLLKVSATVPGGENSAMTGDLFFVDNQVDSATGMIRLKAKFENEEKRLWPGLFVNVNLNLASEADAVVVSSQAVQEGQKGSFVYVVKTDSTAEFRPVVVRRVIEGEAVISKGVQPGEQVVTDGQLRLVPGAKMEIKSAIAEGTPSKP